MSSRNPRCWARNIRPMLCIFGPVSASQLLLLLLLLQLLIPVSTHIPVNIKKCIKFAQGRPNVFDVGPTLCKCYTNGLCLLGCCGCCCCCCCCCCWSVSLILVPVDLFSWFTQPPYWRGLTSFETDWKSASGCGNRPTWHESPRLSAPYQWARVYDIVPTMTQHCAIIQYWYG